MAWNDMTREQMEAQLLRQAQTIGQMRDGLTQIETLAVASAVVVTAERLGRTLTQIDRIAKVALRGDKTAPLSTE